MTSKDCLQCDSCHIGLTRQPVRLKEKVQKILPVDQAGPGLPAPLTSQLTSFMVSNETQNLTTPSDHSPGSLQPIGTRISEWVPLNQEVSNILPLGHRVATVLQAVAPRGGNLPPNINQVNSELKGWVNPLFAAIF